MPHESPQPKPVSDDRVPAARLLNRPETAADTVPKEMSVERAIPYILAIFVLLLFIVSYGRQGGTMAMSFWELQNTLKLVDFVKSFLAVALCDFAAFLVLGILLALFVSRSTDLDERWRLVKVALPAMGLGVMTAFVLYLIEVTPNFYSLRMFGTAASLVGLTLGTWVGVNLIQGPHKRRWIIPKCAALSVVIGYGLYLCTTMALEDQARVHGMSQIASAEKRRLVDLILEKDPRAVAKNTTETLELTSGDVNLLIAWGLTLGSSDRAINVGFRSQTATLKGTARIPWRRSGLYLNLECICQPQIEDGRLRVGLQDLRVGRLRCPSLLSSLISKVVSEVASSDRHVKPVLASIQQLNLAPGTITASYTTVVLPPGFRADVFDRLRMQKGLIEPTRAHVTNLLAVVHQIQPGDVGLEKLVTEAFSLAQKRSESGDPVLENRAALAALGILLGHHKLEELIGDIFAGTRPDASRKIFRKMRMRGRQDWMRHFMVSAAIAQISSDAASDAMGIFKEELDAVGDSGFSFADLLADRAGTIFSMHATKSEETARALQARCAHGFKTEDFLPAAEGLPEGIPEDEFQRIYGGVGSGLYRRFADEIERRIAKCPAYN